MKRKLFLLLNLIFLTWNPIPAFSQDNNPPLNRFFYHGDGTLHVQNQKIKFREGSAGYQEAGLQQINRLFRGQWNPPEERLSLRFIEMLDFLQDQMKGQTYRVKSGYRSPKFNQSLRNKGKLAAQSSMHIEAAAGDLILGGIPSKTVYEYVKSLDCCGIGWYGSAHFHLDTGPARFWTRSTSKTEDKTPQENKKIIIQPDFDRYFPQETLDLKLMRITNFPIGLSPQAKMIPVSTSNTKDSQPISLSFQASASSKEACLILDRRAQARNIKATLPKKLKPGKYQIQVSFCDRDNYANMPAEILSRSFEVLKK